MICMTILRKHLSAIVETLHIKEHNNTIGTKPSLICWFFMQATSQLNLVSNWLHNTDLQGIYL